MGRVDGCKKFGKSENVKSLFKYGTHMVSGPRIVNPWIRGIGYAFFLVIAIFMSKDGYWIFALGILMMVVGGSLNTLVLAKNRWKMPVYIPKGKADAFDRFLETRYYRQYFRFQDKNDPEVRCKFLVDKFYLLDGIFSFGDFVVYFSIVFFFLQPFFVK